MIVRTITFPVRLTYGTTKLAAKTGYKAGRASVKGTYKAGALVGYSRMLWVAVGVGIGLIVAPTSGPELREKIKGAWAERQGAGSDDEIADRVRQALAESPRTWHLPQPAVEVVAGTAILSGSAPHATGKEDIERAAAGVAGVMDVDSRLVVGVSDSLDSPSEG
jgi:BON domain